VGLLPAEAQGQAKRVALVVGNSAYKLGPLANPANDAAAIAEALEKKLGFDKVLLRKNLDAQGFRAALLELSRETTGAELGLVYFAGHGMEVGGKNYLIPVDATLAKASALALEAIPLDAVLEQLDGVTRLKLVILDACRNNPFLADRRGSRGLARFDPQANSLIAYAAREGTAADDGAGRHSPYTAALLKHIATPGLEINLLFRRVRTDVLAATGGAQQPAEYHSLGDKEIFLVPKKGSDLAGLTPGPPVLTLPQAPADVAWSAVADSDDIAALELFRKLHGKERPIQDRLAALRIEALQRQKLALLKSEADRKRQEEEAKRDPALAVKPGSGASFRDRTADGAPCPECPEMVVVPAGSFTMGSPPGEEGRESWQKGTESPQRRVTIGRPFAVGKFEVTFAEWDACLAESGCSHRPEDQGWGRGKRPVINVSWDDIMQQYLPWLNRKTGKTYRLLTEAEWEYMARAGTTTPFWWGTRISPSQANYDGNYTYAGGPKGEYRAKTVPVDSFAPSPWGLYNVHGNVWEWVQDCWNDSYNGAPTDGLAWTIGDCGHRVLRGGSWNNGSWGLRAAYRLEYSSYYRLHVSGFRLGRTL
jgi:formylglycine-generating enzyme required for sulfatase activity